MEPRVDRMERGLVDWCTVNLMAEKKKCQPIVVVVVVIPFFCSFKAEYMQHKIGRLEPDSL